ncbi:response regulator transcription factor [Flavobacterium amnicola]|jgi:two-component system, NarL family, response regulator NreC|uniref:Response regulator transcription factor n=1 Tax=Flavobacterium amnicola TaxID=2506422 RepID=A0A4Q1K530_9FLAO|nr:response regulator [Flavobacterium amnicola]RXR20878.1 response regulator transcription factor [Flavobacterium amnicola]
MKLKVLMVDDHPSMIEGYKIILSYNTSGYEIETAVAYNCETAYQLLNSTKFDIVFLDYSLPPFEEQNIHNGVDLAKFIRKKEIKSKIVILTSHSESIILYDIIIATDPDGLLVKSDFSADELLIAFEKIVNGENYRSATVTHNVKELLANKVYLDDYNRKIITLLSQGIKTKSIPNYINISMSSVEKRKTQIRDYFGLKKASDEDILREAKKAGLL